MATEREEALKVLRYLQLKKGCRGARIHHETMDRRANAIRCLLGLCGSCNYLRIRIVCPHYGQDVSLSCTMNLNPIELSENTPLGNEFICDKFKDKESK
jgi:hypothetical protein